MISLKDKTIKEIESTVGLSRSVIYKLKDDKVFDALNMKLKTNERARLVFDDNDINNLWLIKFYKDMGYTHKQIRELFENPNFDRTAALNKQISYLENQVEYYQKLLKVAKDIVDIGVTPATLKRGMPDDITYYQMLDIVYLIGASCPDENNELAKEFFNEDKCKSILDTIDKINDCRNSGNSAESDAVQKYVSELQSELSGYLSDSNYAFHSFALGFSSGTEASKDIDNYFGEGTSEYIYQACDYHYRNRNDSTSFDRILAETLTQIIILASKNNPPESSVVQEEIKKLYDYFLAMKFINENDRKQAMSSMIINAVVLNPEIKRVGQQAIDMIASYCKKALEKFFSDISGNGS